METFSIAWRHSRGGDTPVAAGRTIGSGYGDKRVAALCFAANHCCRRIGEGRSGAM